MSEAYDILAAVYDRWQQDHDPVAWADYLVDLDSHLSQRTGGDGHGGSRIVLDLGCGTGTLMIEMARRGYDPIGLDASTAMLQQAQERWQRSCREDPALAEKQRPLWLQQDLRDFELFGTVDLMVCLLDTVNHLLARQDLCDFFAGCAHYLNPGGLLIFDTITKHHLQKSLHDQVFLEDTESHTLIWQNEYDEAESLSISDILLFSQLPDGNYRRQEACIRERYHDLKTLQGIWEPLPFDAIACYNPLSDQPVSPSAQRQVHVLRKRLL